MKKRIIIAVAFVLTIVCALGVLVSCKKEDPVYETRETFNIILEKNNGEAPETKHVVSGDKFDFTSITVKKDGFEFGGWYEDEGLTKKFDENTPITKSITLYASWKKLFSVSFSYTQSETKKIIKTITVAEGKEITAEIAKAKADEIFKEIDDVTFVDWYLEETFNKPATFPCECEGEVTFYAKAKQLVPVKFVYSVNTQKYEKTEYFEYGSAIQLDGIEFEGFKTEEGYSIVWYTDENFENLFDKNSILNEELTLYGKVKRTYKLVCFDGADSYNVYIPEGVRIIDKKDEFPPMEKDGYVFDGWYFDKKFTQKLDMERTLQKDEEVYAKWIKKLSVRFNPNYVGAEVETVSNYSAGDKIESIEPTREGYKFEGWYKEAECINKFDFENEVLQNDIELFAKWSEMFTVSFITNIEGLENPKDIEVKYNGTIELPELDKEGYVLNGWLDEEGNEFTSETKVTRDITLHLDFERLCKVEFVDILPSSRLTITDYVHKGEFVQQPKVGTMQDYRHIYWYTDTSFAEDKKFDFEKTSITEDITLYAIYKKEVHVIIKNDTSIVSDKKYLEGEIIDRPEDPQGKEGLAFKGWYVKINEVETEFDFTKPVNDDVTIYAKWKKILTVRLNLIYKFDEISVVEGEKLVYPTPTRDGYKFGGWYIDDPSTGVLFDIETQTIEESGPRLLVAKWISTSTVTYNVYFKNAEDEDLSHYQTIESGKKATKPSNPSPRAGWTFIGWFTEKTGGVEFDFENPITKDTTLYARWLEDSVETFTVYFKDYDGSKLYEPKTVTSGEKVSKPSTDPSRDNYIFTGWYTEQTGGELFDFNTPITKDTTLYARWTEKSGDTFIITFHDGRREPKKMTVEKGSKVTPPIPTRVNNTFDGWFTASSGGIRVKFDELIVDEDLDFYAKWEMPVSSSGYNVYFFDYDGRVINEQPFTEPFKPNHFADPVYIMKDTDTYPKTFAGWYTDKSFDERYRFDFGTYIDAEDLYVYSKWVDAYTVTFYGDTSAFATVYVEWNKKVQAIGEVPTKDGYDFDGWVTDENGEIPFDFDAPITKDTIIYPKWVEAWTVTYYGADKIPFRKISVKKGGILTVLSKDDVPQKDGYRFVEWYSNEALTEKFEYDNSPITNNMDIYPKWEKVYKITFTYGANEGFNDADRTAIVGEGKIYTPEEHIVDGRVFSASKSSTDRVVGWYYYVQGKKPSDYSDADLFDFSKAITGDVTLYPKWEKFRYRVTFYYDVVINPKTQQEEYGEILVDVGSKIDKSEIPAIEADLEFFNPARELDYWTVKNTEIEKEKFDFDTDLSHDVELKPVWKK